jgi:hypothetical protein
MPRDDVERTAAGNFRTVGLRQKAVGPEVIIEPDSHEQVRRFEAQHVLWLRLIGLDVDRRRRQVDRGDAVAADRFDEAAQVTRRRDNRDTLLCCAWQRKEQRGDCNVPR